MNVKKPENQSWSPLGLLRSARTEQKLLWRIGDREAALLIFAVSMLARCVIMLRYGGVGAEQTESVNVALNLATRGAFANPFATADTGPTAHLAPVFPWLLSVLLRVVGEEAFPFARGILCAIFVSAQYALLPWVARVLRLPRVVGLTAALLAAALPVRMYIETSGGHEAPLTALALVALLGITQSATSRPLCVGVAWGIGLLISPGLLPVLIGILALSAFRSKAAMKFSALVLCCSLVTVFPWVLRNRLALGSFSPIRDNLGLELAVSNNDMASPMLEWNFSPAMARILQHPFKNTSEGIRMQSLGETKYYANRQREAVHWMCSNPGRAVWLMVQRFVFFWFNPAAGIVRTLFLVCLTLGGATGLVLLFGSDRRSAAVFLMIWVTYQMPYYLVEVCTRYRYPIDWTFWLLSTYALWCRVSRNVGANAPLSHR